MKTIAYFCTLLAAVLLDSSAWAGTGMDVEEKVRVLEEKLERVEAKADSARAGMDRFLLRGYGSVGFVDREHDNSSFQASVSPLLLWQVADRALFEAELEVELEDGDTNVELEYGDLSYVLTDWLTLVGGKLFTPFTIFSERLHPSWINKLPDSPVAFARGTAIAPSASLGAAARGGVPLGSTRLNYAVYVANGPEFEGHEEGEEMEEGEESPGQLDFENYDDFENSKAFGGRIGFLPIAQLEVGYSIYYADVDTVTATRTSS